jgi:hypothetical protein
MKITAIVLLILFSAGKSRSQEPPKTWFDFWVGEWNVTWQESDGKIGEGKNTITKILDDAVIQENFRAEVGSLRGYKGTSISVYNSKKNSWHQGYADNQGAYFNFLGDREGEKRIFKTEAVRKDDKLLIQRMVFYDIRENSFTWDWESSEDGGKTWKLNWRINYKRIQ